MFTRVISKLTTHLNDIGKYSKGFFWDHLRHIQIAGYPTGAHQIIPPDQCAQPRFVYSPLVDFAHHRSPCASLSRDCQPHDHCFGKPHACPLPSASFSLCLQSTSHYSFLFSPFHRHLSSLLCHIFSSFETVTITCLCCLFIFINKFKSPFTSPCWTLVTISLICPLYHRILLSPLL